MVNKFKKLIKFKSFNSIDFWEKRYSKEGNSGKGSYGKLADFKARIINKFVQENQVKSIIEFGCGDGNQLGLANYPQYLGVDVSSTTIKLCIKKFNKDKTKSFMHYHPNFFENMGNFFNADLTLSLDVIYHLIEDTLYEKYIHDLFNCSKKFVIIYSNNNSNIQKSSHIKNRVFIDLIKTHYPNFKLIHQISNDYPQQSSCEFFIYEKKL